MALALLKEKPAFCVVVAEPNGLKRLAPCCCGCGCGCCGWPNKPPVAVPKAPVPVELTHTLRKTDKCLQCLFSLYLLVPNDVLFWPKLKPVFGAEEPKSPVPVLGVAVAVAPNRPAVPAAMGLEGPFLPAW